MYIFLQFIELNQLYTVFSLYKFYMWISYSKEIQMLKKC